MGVYERGARWLEGHVDKPDPGSPQILGGRVEGDVAVVLFVVYASDGSGPRALVNRYGRTPGGEWVDEGQGGFGWDDGPLAEGEVLVIGHSETASSEGVVRATVGRARVAGRFAVPGEPKGVFAETDPSGDAFVALEIRSRPRRLTGSSGSEPTNQ